MENLTRKEIMAIFYRAVMEGLGMDPDRKYGKEKPPVRMAYTTMGAPDWGVNDDVIFLSFGDAPGDDTTQPVHEEWVEGKDTITRRHFMNRILRVRFNAYGPKSYDNLLKIRHLFIDEMKVLKDADIRIIPSGELPRYAPELYQNMWWNRADMVLSFNSTLSWDEEKLPIEHVDVTIHDNPEGTTKTVTDKDSVDTRTDTRTDSGIIIKKG